MCYVHDSRKKRMPESKVRALFPDVSCKHVSSPVVVQVTTNDHRESYGKKIINVIL
jgi:hypothetical protein